MRLVKQLINRRGSSAVFLAMAFTAFAICIVGSIGISRQMVIQSECEAFGKIWTRAILSEYDRHLLSDYGIMAYFGNEIEVRNRIDHYLGYSAEGKLDADFGKTGADLTGYELGEPDNFRTAMKKGAAGTVVGSLINGVSRTIRENAINSGDESISGEVEDRKINNTVVLDTLPSAGIGNSIDTDSIIERAKSLGESGSPMSLISGAGVDVAFIWQHFGNNVTVSDGGKAYFRNEWEYILCGKPSDETNLKSCRRKLFLIRNALDLASLYKDPAKVEILMTTAELITPGFGTATQVLLAEAWAALEAEKDLEDLYEGNQVPVLKSSDEWKTGLDRVLDSESVRKQLDEEARGLLDENRDELKQLDGIRTAGDVLTKGLNYDEHLLLMILSMKESTRLLRIMDLVQINMKYRYYRDFDLMEYFVGLRYTIMAQGRDYYFEDSYK